MPKLNSYIEVGFCSGYGDGDYRVSAAVADMSYEQIRELKATLIDAGNCMADMWKREQEKKHPAATEMRAANDPG